MALKKVVNFCKYQQMKYMVHLGETGYFMETTPLDPHSPYSSSKAGADLMVKAYSDTL